MSERIKGVVRWFNNERGFGFIGPEDAEKDVFVHFTALQMDGYKRLYPKQTVEFSIEDGPQGRQAADVISLE